MVPGVTDVVVRDASLEDALGITRVRVRTWQAAYAHIFPEDELAALWVLEDNPRTRRFYELAGWSCDGGSKDEEWLGTSVREVRYRINLETTT